LLIDNDGLWIKHGEGNYCVQFTGDCCTFTDSSNDGPQNLGHVKVDE